MERVEQDGARHDEAASEVKGGVDVYGRVKTGAQCIAALILILCSLPAGEIDDGVL